MSTIWANSEPDQTRALEGEMTADFGSTAQKTLAVSAHRSVLVVPFGDSRPGLAGTGGRTSSCRLTGFSSRQTTGSERIGRLFIDGQHVFHLADILVIQFGEHHIFFPPRLQIVALQQDANCFAADAWHQFALHGFVGDETHGPSRAAFGWIAADHRDNPLPLGCRLSSGDAPGRCFSYRARSRPPFRYRCAMTRTALDVSVFKAAAVAGAVAPSARWSRAKARKTTLAG